MCKYVARTIEELTSLGFQPMTVRLPNRGGGWRTIVTDYYIHLYHLPQPIIVRPTGGGYVELPYVPDKDGYDRQVYYVGNKQLWLFRHIIICAMAHPQGANCGEVVNHIDHDKTNNHPSNLEWCTIKENAEWSALHPEMVYHRPDTRPFVQLRKIRKDVRDNRYELVQYWPSLKLFPKEFDGRKCQKAYVYHNLIGRSSHYHWNVFVYYDEFDRWIIEHNAKIINR